MSSYIEIETAKGLIKMPYVHSVEIEQGWKDMTGTATIKLAKQIYVRGADFSRTPLSKIVKAGDKVLIRLGYELQTRTSNTSTSEALKQVQGDIPIEFIGYVLRVNPKVPMEIECEDEMFQLKRRRIAPKVFKNGMLSDVIKYIVPEHETDILDTSLGATLMISSDQPTAVHVLSLIEEVYGLKSWWKLRDDGTPVLVVGKHYLTEAGSKTINYSLSRNVIDNDLEQTRAEDLQVKVSVKSRQADGKVLSNKFEGDPGDGETKSLKIPGLSQTQVEQYARRLYDETKVDRLEGSITTFGIPRIKPGQKAHIETADFEIESANHYVDKRTIKFGPEGYRVTVELGAKAS